jgi:hypothetical protein
MIWGGLLMVTSSDREPVVRQAAKLRCLKAGAAVGTL